MEDSNEESEDEVQDSVEGDDLLQVIFEGRSRPPSSLVIRPKNVTTVPKIERGEDSSSNVNPAKSIIDILTARVSSALNSLDLASSGLLSPLECQVDHMDKEIRDPQLSQGANLYVYDSKESLLQEMGLKPRLISSTLNPVTIVPGHSDLLKHLVMPSDHTTSDSPTDPLPHESSTSKQTLTSDPQTSDPPTSDPQTSDPQTSDPQTSDPQTSDPQTSDPQTSDPQTSTDLDVKPSNLSDNSSEKIFRQYPPTKEEFFRGWKKVRTSPQNYGVNLPLMSAINDLNLEYRRARGNYLKISSSQEDHLNLNYRKIPMEHIPLEPIRGRELFYKWKPVTDPNLLKEQMDRYQMYIQKYPHLPKLTSNDFKFNPATVRTYMKKAEEWDSIVMQGQFQKDIKSSRVVFQEPPPTPGAPYLPKGGNSFSYYPSNPPSVIPQGVGRYPVVPQPTGTHHPFPVIKNVNVKQPQGVKISAPKNQWTKSKPLPSKPPAVSAQGVRKYPVMPQATRIPKIPEPRRQGTRSKNMPRPARSSPKAPMFDTQNSYDRARAKVKEDMVMNRYEKQLQQVRNGKTPTELIEFVLKTYDLTGPKWRTI